MSKKKRIFTGGGGFLAETYRESGTRGLIRKITAAAKMYLPIIAMGRRTNKSVGAYFDLITDDARMFYGDSFHFGYFKNGDEGMDEALANHTDAVAEMAHVTSAKKVLDLGCGICAPAIRIAKKHPCHITGVNISTEQVRQARICIEKEGLEDRIDVMVANALDLDFEDESFDSIMCLEVAGDICVKKSQKARLASEICRVLKPCGRVGFSDLVFTSAPDTEDEKAMRAILYHEGEELVTDWPGIFKDEGFRIESVSDIIGKTMKTWEHSLAVYERNAEEVDRRYGKKIANQTREHLRRIPTILEKYGAFIMMSAQKPA